MMQKFEANVSQSRNDIFWEFITPIFWVDNINIAENSKGDSTQILRWTGYDDAYWWENVGSIPSQRTDMFGNVWELDYNTDEVTLVKKVKGLYI